MSKVTELEDAVLVQMYITLRDRRAQRKAAFTEEDAGDATKQDKIERELLRRFNERGVDAVSIRGVGTAYRSMRTSATVADRDAFFSWVLADVSERISFLESRVSKTAVDQFKAANDDLPPGVNWSSSVTVNFQRN